MGSSFQLAAISLYWEEGYTEAKRYHPSDFGQQCVLWEKYAVLRLLD